MSTLHRGLIRAVLRPWLASVLLLVAVVLAFGVPYVTSQDWPYYFYLDNSGMGAYTRFILTELAAGNPFPMWNSVNSQPGSFTAQHLLDAVLYYATGSAYSVAKVEHVLLVLLAAILAYSLARWYTHDERAAVVAGLFFGFSPFLLASVTYYPPMWGWVILPLGLLGIEYSFSRPSAKRILGATIELSLSLVVFPQNVYVLGLVYLALIAFRIIMPIEGTQAAKLSTRLAIAATLLVGTLGLSGPDLFSFLVSRTYPAPFESGAYYIHYSFPGNVPPMSDTIPEALRLLNKEPLAWLRSYNGFNLSPSYGAWSTLPVILFAFSLLTSRSRNTVTIFYATVSTILIVMSTGTLYGIWGYLRSVLPYFSLFNEPTRLLIGVALGFSLVIGVAVAALRSRKPSETHPWDSRSLSKSLLRKRLLVSCMIVITLGYLISPVPWAWHAFAGISPPADMQASQSFFKDSENAYHVLDVASPLFTANFYTYGTSNFWNYYDITQRYGNRPYSPDLLGEIGYKYVLYSPSTSFKPYGGPIDFYTSISQSSRTSAHKLYSYAQDDCSALDPNTVLFRDSTDLLNGAWSLEHVEYMTNPHISSEGQVATLSAYSNGAGRAYFVDDLRTPIAMADGLIRISFKTMTYPSRLELFLGNTSGFTMIEKPIGSREYFPSQKGEMPIPDVFALDYTTYLLNPASVVGPNFTLTKIMLGLSSRLDGYVGPLEVKVKEISLVHLNTITSEDATPLIEYFGWNGALDAGFGAIFDSKHPERAFVQVIISEPSLYNASCFVLKGGVSDPDTVLSVRVRYSDGTVTQSDITQVDVPEFIQNRIYALPNRKISEISLIVRAARSVSSFQGYHAARIIDSDLYVFEIRDPRPKVSEAYGMYVIGGPDAYAYLLAPGFPSSDFVPVFSGMNALKPSDRDMYSAFVFHNTDLLDLAVLLGNRTDLVELWQQVQPSLAGSYEITPCYTGCSQVGQDDWGVWRRFVAFQYASQVQNNAYGQFVSSRYAVVTESNSSLRFSVRLNQSASYHFILRTMGLSVDMQQIRVHIELDGHVIEKDAPRSRFAVIDLGELDLPAGNHTLSISKLGEGRLLGDYVALVPDQDWEKWKTMAESLLADYNGSILGLYDAASYVALSEPPKPTSLPLQLVDAGMQLSSRAVAEYDLVIPQSGTYYFFVHSLVANATFQVQVLDKAGIVTSMVLDHTVNPGVMWHFQTSPAGYLKNGSYRIALSNLGPSSTVFDMYGVAKLEGADSKLHPLVINRQTSDQVSAQGIDRGRFIVYTETFNDGWSARSGKRFLEHLHGFFFLNTFYADGIETDSIDILFNASEFIAVLYLILAITIGAFIVGLVLNASPLKAKLKRHVI